MAKLEKTRLFNVRCGEKGNDAAARTEIASLAAKVFLDEGGHEVGIGPKFQTGLFLYETKVLVDLNDTLVSVKQVFHNSPYTATAERFAPLFSENADLAAAGAVPECSFDVPGFLRLP